MNSGPVRLGCLLIIFSLGASLPAVPLADQAPAQVPPLEPEVQNRFPAPAASSETLRIVSFNVHKGQDTPGLVKTIRKTPALCDADIFLVQEIESQPSESASRARQLAEALELNYVYAPARRIETGGTHGLAILSRFPLSEIEVIPLPQFSLRFNTRRRIALAVTVTVGDRSLRLYNLHLDTRLNTKDRLAQLRPVVEAARAHPAPAAVVGGDFNTNPFRWAFRVFPIFRSNQAKAVDEFMREQGFQTPFAQADATLHRSLLKIRVDALYTRGLVARRFAVEEEVTVSDHRPLWLDVAWPEEQASGAGSLP